MFDISITRDALHAAMQLHMRVIDKRTIVPVLGNVLIEAKGDLISILRELPAGHDVIADAPEVGPNGGGGPWQISSDGDDSSVFLLMPARA